MTVFIIFWASVFCVVFFLLGTICKVLASAFQAMVNALELVIGFGILSVMAIIALYIIYFVVSGITSGHLGTLFQLFILGALEVGLVFLIFGPIGSLLYSVFQGLFVYFFYIISAALNKGSILFEGIYLHFLKAIIKNTTGLEVKNG